MAKAMGPEQQDQIKAAVVESLLTPTEITQLIGQVLDDMPLPPGTAPEIATLYNHFRRLLNAAGVSKETLGNTLREVYSSYGLTDASVGLKKEIYGYASEYCQIDQEPMFIQLLVNKFGISSERVGRHIAKAKYDAVSGAIELILKTYGLPLHCSDIRNPQLQLKDVQDDRVYFSYTFQVTHPEHGEAQFECMICYHPLMDDESFRYLPNVRRDIPKSESAN